MKKIISIILGIMLMLSMSVTSFAANWGAPATPDAPAKVDTVVLTTDLGDFDTSLNTGTAYITKTTMTVEIDTTKSNTNVTLSDLDVDVCAKLPVINPETEKVEIIDLTVSGEWREDLDHTINKKGNGSAHYDIYINYDHTKLPVSGENAVVFIITINDCDPQLTTIHNSEPAREDNILGSALTWNLELQADTPAVDEEDTNTEDESTNDESEVTPPADDKTEVEEDAEVTDPTPDNTPSDKEEEVEDDYVAPDTDVEIPDTGATVPFAAIGTLVTSAITALVAKKKKEN